MPRTKHDDYKCPRCNYETSHKAKMRLHFYKRNKVCPATMHDIELTNEIKAFILENRVYHPSQTTGQKVINQTINNYNVLNSFVASLDNLSKINTFVSYKQLHTKTFDYSIDETYKKTKKKLELGQGHHKIQQDDIFEIIDNVTRVNKNSIEDFNILFDSDLNKLVVFDSGQWVEMFIASGLIHIVKTIQDYFLNAYECYLIRKVEKINITPFEREEIRLLLKAYFTFLASIGCEPFIINRPNVQIVNNPDDDKYDEDIDPFDEASFSLSTKYYPLYSTIRENLVAKEKECLKGKIIDQIKRNCRKNVKELNAAILSLIVMDEEFKQTILSSGVQI